MMMDDSKPDVSADAASAADTAPDTAPDGSTAAASAEGTRAQQNGAAGAAAGQTGGGAGSSAEIGDDSGYAAMIAEFEAALADERARADKLLDQTQRMAAEFQNSRKRQEAQLNEEIERASAHVIKRLLPVLDDLDLAFTHVPAELETGAAWVEGFRQIQKKLQNILAEEGVVTIRDEGEFDPTLHEAVSSEPNDSVPSGHVIATLRAGYTYKGKVLRPALVRVAM